MDITSFLDSSLSLAKIEVKDREDLLHIMSDKLYQKNYVKESFFEGLIAREEKYPTGLKFIGYGCALPHTEPGHVIAPAIAIATLKTPVIFNRMDDPEDTVEIDVVFMLALKKSDDQIDSLRKLSLMMQNTEFISKIRSAESGEEILALIKEEEGERNKTR